MVVTIAHTGEDIEVITTTERTHRNDQPSKKKAPSPSVVAATANNPTPTSQVATPTLKPSLKVSKDTTKDMKDSRSSAHQDTKQDMNKSMERSSSSMSSDYRDNRRHHQRDHDRRDMGGPGDGNHDQMIETTARKIEKKFTQRCRLFVGNLTPDTTEDEFKSLFEKYGEISEVFLNKSKGFGFIRLVNLT